MITKEEIATLRSIMLGLAITTRNLMYSTLSQTLSEEKFTQLCETHGNCDHALEGLTLFASDISSPQIDIFMGEWDALAGATQDFLNSLTSTNS